MSRAVLLYLLVILAPAVALGFFAFRVADGEFSRRMTEHQSSLEREASRLAATVEEALAEAARRAVEDVAAPVGHARDGRRLGFSSGDEGPEGAEPGVADDEGKLYEISMRGGESFEHALRDPARALDAYTFYLPRVRSRALRARLRLCAGRSAALAGQAALGQAILRELSREPPGVSTEEGIPIALAASSLLAEPAPGLERFVAHRRALERAVTARPEVLASADAVLHEGRLLFARDGSNGLREIRLASIAMPPLGLPDRAADILPSSPTGELWAASPGEAVAPIRLGKDGPVLALSSVRDTAFAEIAAQAGAQRGILRGLVLLLVAVTLAGGIVLVTYLTRERRLAKLRTQLLANVSHELKTPVTSIRLFSEMLSEDGADPEQARRYGLHIASEGQRLSQLVENLLDVSRLGRKEQALLREPVDLAALLRRIAGSFEFQAREKQVDFAADGLASGEVIATTNAPAVERIVLNLLDNAVKYRRPEDPSVRLRLETHGNAVRVVVADNGIGIPRRDQERVFEELYRVRYDDYAVKGSGLGLSIARALARKLGGDVTLEPRDGAGSTFTLLLPANGGVDDARAHPGR